MIKSTFEIEKELLGQGFDFVIGTDEVGRGPLAGPVVAAAVMLRNFQLPITNLQTIYNDQMWDLVRDSKKLSEKQREKIFDFIHENFYVGIGLCDHETIDRINILEASFLAMKKAVQEMARNVERETRNAEHGKDSKRSTLHAPRYVILVDGNKQIPNFSHEQKAIVGGDGVSKSISAASIVAKVTRDRMMLDMHKKFPNYGFDKHKGYGTKLHLDALKVCGPCEIHRKSFDPVTRLLRNSG